MISAALPMPLHLAVAKATLRHSRFAADVEHVDDVFVGAGFIAAYDDCLIGIELAPSPSAFS